MKNNKFKIGDIVCGNNEGKYFITNIEMTEGKVIAVSKGGFIDVKILAHSSLPSQVGVVCDSLNPKYFSLVKSVSAPENLYHFTTDMATFVEVEHGDKKAKSKCDIRCDEFNIHTGVDLAMERLNKEENKDEMPKYVRMLVNTCGLKRGDITKVLSSAKRGDFDCYYVVSPKNSIYTGNNAKNPENLKGVNFTYISQEDYEPVTIYG